MDGKLGRESDRTTQHFRAAIFYCLTTAEMADPPRMTRGLRDVRSRGFDAVYLDCRNVRPGCHTASFCRAAAEFCRRADALGLRVVVDANPLRLAADMLREAPEAFVESVVPLRCRVRRGLFHTLRTGEPEHETVEGCWRIEPDANTRADDRRLASARPVGRRLRRLRAVSEGGGCAMTRRTGAAATRTTYRVTGMEDGEVLLVLRKRWEYAFADLGHPALRIYARRMLDLYRGLPVSGYAWDEPHFGFAFWPDDGRAVSDRLYAAFAAAHGFDLRARLPDLWFDVRGHDAWRTRLAYAAHLDGALAALERDFARQARRSRPRAPAPVVGIHRTMHEETSDDFLIGCVDYFRHGCHTTGGFTDGVFTREDSMVAMLQLARSLAAETGTGPAYHNSWAFLPRERHHAYYLNLMGAMNVRWIAHTYHGSHLFGPGYPDHPLWATLRPHLLRHRRALALLDGAEPEADTAVVYHWPALAATPGPYLHVHRRNLLLLALELTCAGVPWRFVGDVPSPRRGRFPYRRLILPWPDLLSEAAWEHLEAARDAGVQITLFGPPAVRAREGRDARARFARFCGLRTGNAPAPGEVGEGAVLRGMGGTFSLAPRRIAPGYYSNHAASYPRRWRVYALDAASDARVLATHDGAPIAVRHGPVSYFGCELPHYAGLVATLFGEAALPRGLLIFRYRRGAQRLIAGTGRGGRQVSGRFAWDGGTVTLRRCDRFVVAGGANGPRVLLGEGVEATADGCRKAGADGPAEERI